MTARVQTTPQTVIVVSHGGAISALMNYVMMLGGTDVLAPGVAKSRMWNCSVTEVLVPVAQASSAPVALGSAACTSDAFAPAPAIRSVSHPALPDLDTIAHESLRPRIVRWADTAHLHESVHFVKNVDEAA